MPNLPHHNHCNNHVSILFAIIMVIMTKIIHPQFKFKFNFTFRNDLLSSIINFNQSNFDILFFNFVRFIAPMILSRFLAPFKFLNRYAFANVYSRESRPQPTKLQFQILQAKSFSDFYRIFDENRSEFTPEMYSFCSKTITSVVYRNKDILNAQQAFDFIKSLESVDVNLLDERNIINILSILRSFKIKRINLFAFNNFKNSLAEKLGQIFKAKTVKNEDLGYLLNAHYEVVFLKDHYVSKIVAGKIWNILLQGKRQNDIQIAPSQLTFMLYSLSQKNDLSKTENAIRFILLEKIKKQFDNMKIEDIVNIGISLNKMDILDFQPLEFQVFRNITNKIIEKITDLDQKSVFSLIKAQSNSKFPGFNKIYEEIIHSIFAEIKEDGQSNIDSDSIFKVLHYLSSKIDINKAGPKQHLKLFAFLQKRAKQVQNTEKKDTFAYHIDELVKNNFFDKNQKQLLVNLFQKYQLSPNLILVYYMSIKYYSVEQFIPFLTNLQLTKLKNIDKYRLVVILYLLKSQNKELLAIKENIQSSLAENYYTPQNFIEFYRIIKREKQNLHFIHFHQANSALFARLPNPFQTKSDFVLYRQTYLDYVSLFFQSRDYSAFLQKHQADIGVDQVMYLIRDHLHDEQRRIEPELQLIGLLLRRFNAIILSKNKKHLQVVLDFVQKYNKFVLYRTLPPGYEQILFKIIHSLINQSKLLVEQDLFSYFGTILEKYLTRNFNNYNIEKNYRGLLKHLIAKIPQFTVKSNVNKYIITEALRLNILTKQNIEKVDLDSIQLPYFTKLSATYLKDSKFLPTLRQLTQNSLLVVLQNHNFDSYVKENQAKILSIIQSASIHDLQKYAINFNQLKNPCSLKILNQILKKIASKDIYFERIDVIGIIRCALDKNYFFLNGYKQIAQKMLETYKQKIGAFTIDTHLQILRFLITQPEIKAQEYYSALLKWAEDSKDPQETQTQTLLARLAHTNYEFKESQISLASSITKKNAFQGLFYFLALENKFQTSEKPALVQQICENLTKTLQEEKKGDGKDITRTFQRLYYNYLKSKYPQQTESFTVSDEHLVDYVFSEKPKTINLLQQIAEITQNEIQEVKNFGQNNYIIRIKNFVFFHILAKKKGSIYELQFIKRAIPQLLGQPVTVASINQNGSLFSLESIAQQCEGLLTVQQISQLKGRINEKKLKYKQKVTEEGQQI